MPAYKKPEITPLEKIYGAGRAEKRNSCNIHNSLQNKSPSRRLKARSPCKVHMKKYSMITQLQTVRN